MVIWIIVAYFVGVFTSEWAKDKLTRLWARLPWSD